MNRFELLTQYSPWFYILCLLVGGIYAVALYFRAPMPWSNGVNRLLAVARFLLVSLLCFLLLGPFVRRIRNTAENPTVVLAVDDSESVRLGSDSAAVQGLMASLEQTAEQLRNEEVNVEIRSLSGRVNQVDSLTFRQPTTDLTELLTGVQSDYENRNLGGVVLVSDGIYNQGISPAYRNFGFPVYAIGVGDTTPKQDLNLKAVYYNKIAYLGNRFPIVAEVQNAGFAGQEAVVRLRQRGKVLATERLPLNEADGLQQVTFYASSQEKGMQRYEVEVQPLEQEFTTQNNVRSAYVDIIDAREKILIVARSPHPDIKAIRSALEEQEDYEVVVHIPGVNDLPDDQYDLIIFHQLPTFNGSGNSLVTQLTKGNKPVWYILGSQTDLNTFNSVNGALTVSARGRQRDNVTGSLNPNFTRFRIENALQTLLPRFPPLSVPFGEFSMSTGTETVLSQRVGRVETDKSLLVYRQNGGQKTAVLVGEGLWQWRLQEYELTEKQEATDELILKLVQLLSAKEDKRQFRVTPITDEFLEADRVVFDVEIYNDIYEKIYNQKVELRITNEENETTSYSFVNSESNSRLDIGSLPQGVYSYRATTPINGKTEVSTGQFSIRRPELEALNLTADYDLLRQVATQTGGQFFTASQLGELQNYLATNQPKPLIRSSEDLTELINVEWLFFVLLALVSLEWFLRKYQGAY
ncbi:hypothetical protein SAMN05421823_10138 [Catalinimonas alkaloidigena]|uniref:VWA domain-containing protein n=1 Tax=Catalinimonas alkaloidigena TaxID=1075417 RepID=A0A1G8WEA9_9BACT|nr:vWA domain-containing protein [Catalinimonas alkaloidigena]SDJ76025.1 hypothetical protein SAMN05421823_10138 [Catalinimonas alkaloidigena]